MVVAQEARRRDAAKASVRECGRDRPLFLGGFVEGEVGCRKVCGIVADVADGIGEMLFVPDECVAVTALADGVFSNSAGGDAFPFADEFFKGVAGCEKQVNVVWHDDPGMMLCESSFAIFENGFKMVAMIGDTEEAGARRRALLIHAPSSSPRRLASSLKASVPPSVAHHFRTSSKST